MAKPTTSVRSAVYARDNYRCVLCNASDSLEWNHRAAVGMGGSRKRPCAEEGVVLCSTCNTAIESTASIATVALAFGVKVRKWADPTMAPVYYPHEHQWYRLEGTTRHPVTAVVALDLMHAVYGDEYMHWYGEAKN